MPKTPLEFAFHESHDEEYYDSYVKFFINGDYLAGLILPFLLAIPIIISAAALPLLTYCIWLGPETLARNLLMSKCSIQAVLAVPRRARELTLAKGEPHRPAAAT